MNLTFHDGDLLDSGADVICHQVNCQGVMSAGIAPQIKNRWPRVFGQYRKMCQDYKAEGKVPLGKCQMVYTDDSKTQVVANLFGQQYYGRGKKQTDYDALRNALHLLVNSKYLSKNCLTVAFPYKIGAGLGGGDWDVILDIIKDEFKNYPGEVQIWKLG